jgi:hypothetical protein
MPVEDRTTNPPPVAHAGSDFAGTIHPTTGVLTVLLNGQGSFAVADGATIVSYQWDIHDGTLLAGTLNDSFITAVFPWGFRYVDLTVTDSNGHSHTTHVPVYGRFPDNDTSITHFEIAGHSFDEDGQRLDVRVYEDISAYPDGALVLIWEREPSGSSADRAHMLFTGWMHSKPTVIQEQREGTVKATTLQLLDVAGKLDTLPAFPQALADDSTRIGEEIPAITWSYMVSPNLDKYLHYLLYWHSTAFEVAPITLSNTWEQFPFVLLSSQGDSLWKQVQRRAEALVPSHVLSCDKQGRITVVPDAMLQDLADRTAVVQAIISEADWSSIRFTLQRAPRVHWLRNSAIIASTAAETPVDPNTGKLVIATAFSIAPGKSPGQGVGETQHGEQLALSQADLNASTGHRHARINSPYSDVDIDLLVDDGILLAAVPWAAIDPAKKQWVTITISAETAAQLGVSWTTKRTLPKQVTIRYNHSRTGIVRRVTLRAEIETVGLPGITVVKPVVYLPGEQPPPPPWAAYLDGIVAAYEPINGSSLADSYVSRAYPGTYDAVPAGTPPGLSGGWVFDGSLGNHLTTGIAPGMTWTMIVRFHSCTGDNRCAIGVAETRVIIDGTTERGFSLIPRGLTGEDVHHAYNAGVYAGYTPPLTEGVYGLVSGHGYTAETGVLPSFGYIDGVLDQELTTGWAPGSEEPSSLALFIGAQNTDGSPTMPFAGTITHIQIFNRRLTDAEVAQVTGEMNA